MILYKNKSSYSIKKLILVELSNWQYKTLFICYLINLKLSYWLRGGELTTNSS